jgi:Tfp pilus assembly protein PilV
MDRRTWKCERGRRVNPRSPGADGFGLLEVVVALTVLSLTFLAVGRLVVDTLSTSQLAEQRSSAASLIQQVDAVFQSNVPTMTCAAATAYVAGTGSGTATRNGTVNVGNGAGASSTTFTVTSTASTALTTPGKLLPLAIGVAWHPAGTGQPTQTTTDRLQVQCQ